MLNGMDVVPGAVTQSIHSLEITFRWLKKIVLTVNMDISEILGFIMRDVY